VVVWQQQQQASGGDGELSSGGDPFPERGEANAAAFEIRDLVDATDGKSHLRAEDDT